MWGFEDIAHDDVDDEPDDELPFVDKTTRVTVLTGAGISAESGVPTFRGAQGIWNDENMAKLATPRGFLEDPARGWAFYNDRRVNMGGVGPNPAHVSLAQFEKAGYDIVVITQNIDGLHAAAGSRNILELHGSIWEIKCSNAECRLKIYEDREIPMSDLNPKCEVCGSPLRPNVVFFEEQLDPFIVMEAEKRSMESDVFLIVGTSGVVYPAAGFAHVARVYGARLYDINVEPSALSGICHGSVTGKAGDVLPQFLSELTNGEFKPDLNEPD